MLASVPFQLLLHTHTERERGGENQIDKWRMRERGDISKREIERVVSERDGVIY